MVSIAVFLNKVYTPFQVASLRRRTTYAPRTIIEVAAVRYQRERQRPTRKYYTEAENGQAKIMYKVYKGSFVKFGDGVTP